ncbi:hypothetical protein LUZ60_004896 [Juncus effusus]|nr:hypothetical protein LUZ60_004896 [Juncus effusus]
MGDGLTGEVDRLEELWNDWEIRGAIVVSFLIQILLLVTAGYRKRNYGLNLKAVAMSIFLWLEYLFADSIAIFALGYLSQNEGQVSHLVILWAPFLLLHLGGQDTITALSIEDNELWKRHLLTFISQACIAIYVFAKSGRPSSISWAGSLIFFAGIVKYVERIWALQKASMSSLRSSCKMESDIGWYKPICPDYTLLEYGGVVRTAYELSQRMKPILADLTVDVGTWSGTIPKFFEMKVERAYKVIEVELYFMYDILHTKAAVLHKWYGWLFRICTLSCSITALVIFTTSNTTDYNKIEVGITYLLLVGAVVLESFSLAFMLLSLWTYAGMIEGKKCANRLKQGLMFLIGKLRSEEKSEWANCMGQCSVLNYIITCKSDRIGNVMSFFGVKENWDNLWHTEYKPVELELKNLVFSELRNKSSRKNVLSEHGVEISSTLRYLHCYEQLGWSVDKDFDRTILIWHFATDLLLHYHETDKQKEEENKRNNVPSYRDRSEDISKYMLFLLIARPYMLPTGIGQTRFSDTCGHAKDLLQQRRTIAPNLKEATDEILNKINHYEPRPKTRYGLSDPGPDLIVWEHGRTILPDGVKLAKQLQELIVIEEACPNLDRMWKLISVAWVEMLCLAASKCGGNSHMKQLSMGGEFLTHVCFLMAHMGLGEEYRFEDATDVTNRWGNLAYI